MGPIRAEEEPQRTVHGEGARQPVEGITASVARGHTGNRCPGFPAGGHAWGILGCRVEISRHWGFIRPGEIPGPADQGCERRTAGPDYRS
jgi:hypothetical protein